MRVNTQLLDKAIKDSGIKISFLCEKLGLSRNGFEKKRKGITPFRGSEIYVICDLCRISESDKCLIFYPDGSPESEQKGE